METPKKRWALLSVYTKTPEFFELARELVAEGLSLLSSGGTFDKLVEQGIPVTNVSEITGLPPEFLNHRVVTLCPQIHAGLLATPDMRDELDERNWPWIEMLVCRFYPLKEELAREGATFESRLEKTDIGGPTLVRSANKGRRIVFVHEKQFGPAIQWIRAGMPNKDLNILYLQAVAEGHVADYSRDSRANYARALEEHPDRKIGLFDWNQ